MKWKHQYQLDREIIPPTYGTYVPVGKTTVELTLEQEMTITRDLEIMHVK